MPRMAPGRQYHAPEGLNPMKILAVDDDELLLELLVSSLRDGGYTSVTTAASATEAAQIIAAATTPFECFLLDILMPEVDGIELTRWIRATAPYRTTPIVMLTSLSEKASIDRAFLAGASDYVCKPFNAVDVLTRVQMAHRQVTVGRAMHNSEAQIQDLRAQIDERYRAPLSEPIMLENVEGLIDFLAMENYLLQMSRGAFVGTSLFAMRIVAVGDIYARCSPALFHDSLADVAECALAVMTKADCIMAYVGNGAFAGVIGANSTQDPDDLTLEVNMMIERLQLRDDADRPLDIRIAISPPQAIGMFHSGRWVIGQMRKIIEDLAWAMPKAAKQTPLAQFHAGGLMKALTRSIRP